MAKYAKSAGKKVAGVMHEMKAGNLETGGGKKVTSAKQAIAIGLSEAREADAKVPAKKAPAKSSASAKTSVAKTAAKKSTWSKAVSQKAAAKQQTSGKKA